MSRERWDLLMKILEHARGLEPEEVEPYLLEACAGDGELLDDARRILAVEPPTNFIEPPEGPGVEALFGGGLAARRLGDFELVREIGRGGMGVVYLARQLGLERLAAVKVLPLARRTAPLGLERFLREARAASQLDHPGIVGVLASGEAEGLAWYAMPYVKGHDLHTEIRAQRAARAGREPEEPLLLPPFDSAGYVGEVVRRVCELAAAVQHAHDAGVVHRDIKPQNILLGAGGRFQLVDFGLAKLRDEVTITASGDVQGTPHYMSPEQARALTDPVDHRTDVYSLCVVLYELLSLRLPFEGRSLEEVVRHIASGLHRRLRRSNPRVPRDLELVCETGMARRPAERYPSAAALAEDLRRFLDHESVLARAPSPLARVRRWRERHPVLSAALGVAAIGLALALGLGELRARRAREVGWAKRIDAALALASWEGAEDVVADARRAAAEARGDGALGERLTELDRRLGEDAARRAERLRELMRRAKGGYRDAARFGEHLAPGSIRDLLVGLDRAGRARTAHPSDAEIARLAAPEETFPLLRLALAPGVAGSATARAIELDPITGRFGAEWPLGALPLERRLPPGDWRIVVELPGVGFAEYDRDLPLSTVPVDVAARVRPPARAAEGMVELPGAELVLDRPPELGCCRVLESVEVEAFLIDEAEVSNRDYLAFLTDSGHPAPAVWRRLGYAGDWSALPGVDGDPRWLDLPAVGMSLYDMRAFAEWRGARLPTHYELEYALRGEEMLRAPAPGTRANVDGPDSGDVRTTAARYRQYVESTLPVREPGYRQPPFGLFHVRGNVAERTSSKLTQPQGGRIVAHPDFYLQLGGAWDAAHDRDELFEHVGWGIDEQYATTDVGFRCARSLAPEPR